MPNLISHKRIILWGSLSALIVALCVGLVFYQSAVLSKHGLKEAEKAGRSVVVSLESGEITDGVLPPVPEKKAEEPSVETLDESTAVTPEETDKQPSAVEAASAVNAKPEEVAKEEDAPKESAAEHKAEETPAAENPLTLAEKAVGDKKPKEEPIPATTEPEAPPAPKARIAIIVGGLGLNGATTERALELPITITLGFSPYAHDVKGWMDKAVKQGFQTLMHAPMQTMDYPADDAGPYALLTDLDEKENIARFDWILSRGDGYIGIYSDPREKFTTAKRAVKPILDSIKAHHLLFAYGAGYTNQSLLQNAKGEDIPVIAIDTVIDDKISANAIQAKLQSLEVTAKKNGYALGLGSPYPITLKIVQDWASGLESRGFMLVPVTRLMP